MTGVADSEAIFCFQFYTHMTTATEETKKKGEPEVVVEDHRPMTALLANMPINRPEVGELVEGPVLSIAAGAVYVDMPPFGVGIIYGREYQSAKDLVKRMNIGDRITAKVVESENADGYVELSLKEARQSQIWAEAESLLKSKNLVEVLVKDANKGGLIMEWQGVQGFLPASQLSGEHYPRVEDGDKDRILEELRKLLGKKLSVSVITASPREGKLIFSEKDHAQKEKGELLSRYQVGEIVEGDVTGIVDFGAFIKVEDGLEGLVHISEIDWGLVDDPRKFLKVGQRARAKVIEIKDNKISLSIKATKENPWREAEKKYKKGDMVRGVVIKFNKYGALASIEEGVAGLVHISEFGGEDKLRGKLELGKTYPFQIALFEPKDQKMTLSFAEAK
jgi:small subunit ribosomal protein S1